MLRITDTYELSGWRPQAMDMPLEFVASCPCCAGGLSPVAGIYCGALAVVVAECRGCGWLGYGTRPSAEWFDSFYASDWDEAGQQASVDLSKCAVHPITKFIPQIAKPPASVCDVGCGFGIAAWQLAQLGYQAYGTESCDHRRNCAARNGIRTFRSLGDFWANYPSKPKFDVVTAHHVLEHSVDPNAFIAEIAEHQDEGGMLYLSVPNQVGEPSMGCLLFLPHLHSFTWMSLSTLAARHGYRPLAVLETGFNLELAYVKGSVTPAKQWMTTSAVEKLSRAIHANGQGPLLSWCGNHTDAWFTNSKRFDVWKQKQWKPRAVRAERVRGPGRFPVELEVPCLFVK